MKTRMKILTMTIMFSLLSIQFYGQTHDCAMALCPDTITVNHRAADVSPMDVTIKYATVQTNLTGTNMCWIAQNLGATTLPAGPTDASAAASGWYWQFNRKQGYYHDGSTRTPNTTWITKIDEDSDWLPENDPCTILLGTGWRIPTNTEWITADGATGGNWSTYEDTYNSVLKLHAAGFLSYSNAALANRGAYGYYWSSVRNSSTKGSALGFYSSSAYVYSDNKALGFPVRCLREL